MGCETLYEQNYTLGMTIDTFGRVGNFTDVTFFPCRKHKYLSDTKSLGIPALSLLDSKQKGAWHLKK